MPYVGSLPECGLYALMWAFCLYVGFLPRNAILSCGLFAFSRHNLGYLHDYLLSSV